MWRKSSSAENCRTKNMKNEFSAENHSIFRGNGLHKRALRSFCFVILPGELPLDLTFSNERSKFKYHTVYCAILQILPCVISQSCACGIGPLLREQLWEKYLKLDCRGANVGCMTSRMVNIPIHLL